ncbi:ANTAR domain-containing protein [Streptomyces sp. NPDC001068]|uniref:ANTAR domain-containing protein n=1 Tax=Streptomyces sp. NPDC001068 TaxID=3364544 RepID=UPI0036CB76E3
MASVGDRRSPADQATADKIARLSEENAQMQQAVASHAVIDQALGVLAAVWQVPPHDGWEMLREVSQSLNIKLHAVAAEVVDWPLGRPMSQSVARELDIRVESWRQRAPQPGQATDGEHTDGGDSAT